MVERSAATIYGVGLYDRGDPDRDPGFLRRIARISGGESYLPAPAEILNVCQRIAKEIRSRYTLGYLATPHREAGALRSIEVRARDSRYRKLGVLTRSSYRYDEIEFP